MHISIIYLQSHDPVQDSVSNLGGKKWIQKSLQLLVLLLL